MVAEQKTEEAEYFLEKIKQALSRSDFVPNLSAFMSSTRSIPDYLLEDYNTKLGLNIPLTKTLYLKDFRREAKNQHNRMAEKFIDRYDIELRKLYNDAVGGLLMSKRNIEIHRTDVPVQAKFSRVLSETISITDSVSIEVRDKNGNLKKRSEPTKPEKSVSQNSHTPENKPIPQPSDSVEWFFTDFKNDNVISVCTKFLDLMKLFITDIRKDYPQSRKVTLIVCGQIDAPSTLLLYVLAAGRLRPVQDQTVRHPADSHYLRTRTADIPMGILSHTTYVVDKKDVIVCEDRTATSYNISRREFKQNAHSKWRMFVATLTSSINVPAAGPESQGIAIFGAIDDTLHFRIEAKNIHEDTGAQLHLRKKGKNGNVIADLVERGKHAYKQGTIIKGSVIGSSLIGPLEGQPISKLIELIEEEKVSVNLYLSSSRHRGIRGIIHCARRAVLNPQN